MNFPFYIAKRYAVSLSKSTAINVITVIASLGIIVSAMALFVVLSVFSGLREFSLSFSNATDSDLKVEPFSGKNYCISPQQMQQLKAYKGLAAFSEVVEERALFFYNEKEQVAQLKGVDTQFNKVNEFHKFLFAGSWIESQSNEAVQATGHCASSSFGR